MNLNYFLERKGTTLQELVQTIWGELDGAPGDQLLAVGSLVEGVGNLTSDVDFILLSDRVIDPMVTAAPVSRKSVTAGGVICDIEIVPRQVLEAKHALLSDWSAQPRPLAETKMLTDPDYRLLHRVTHSRKVAGMTHDSLDEQNCRRLLALYKFERARYEAYALLVDIPGFIGEGHWTTLAIASNELLGHSCDAVLAAHGVTAPTTKWRFQFLERSCRIGHGSDRQPGHEFVAPLISLHRWPSSLDQDAMMGHARRVVAVARAVFLWARSFMTSGMDSVPALPPNLDRTDAMENTARGVTLDFDVAFVFPDDEIHLVRLNRAESRVKVSARLAALLCRFDGITSREELRRYAAKLSRSGTPLVLEEAEAMVALLGLAARAYVGDRLEEVLGKRSASSADIA